MPWVGFEPTIAAGERPKTYALDRTATGTGVYNTETYKLFLNKLINKWNLRARISLLHNT